MANITSITTDDLRHMQEQEGLIIMGCSGSLEQWVNDVNDALTESGILLNGTRFEDVRSFQQGKRTNLLFPLDDKVQVNMEQLAIWRLRTHACYEGTWLSDYVENYLGGFLRDQPSKQKPVMNLVGEDGNIFSVLGRASKLLRQAGQAKEAEEMTKRVMNDAHSYGEALKIISEYVQTELSEEAPKPPTPHKKKSRGGKVR